LDFFQPLTRFALSGAKKKEEITMKNVEIKIEGTMLMIIVDLNKTFGPSKSGKTTVIASTEGNQAITPGTYLGLNVYKK
jgi:hypothetical protein